MDFFNVITEWIISSLMFRRKWLQWRHMRVMTSQITGNSIACSGQQLIQANRKKNIEPIWEESTINLRISSQKGQ